MISFWEPFGSPLAARRTCPNDSHPASKSWVDDETWAKGLIISRQESF